MGPNPTVLKKTALYPDLKVYGADEPNFRVVVPDNKGFDPKGRVQVKLKNPKLGGFMFDEGTASVTDSAVIFADKLEVIK